MFTLLKVIGNSSDRDETSQAHIHNSARGALERLSSLSRADVAVVSQRLLGHLEQFRSITHNKIT